MLESDIPHLPAVDGGRIDAGAFDFTTGGHQLSLLCACGKRGIELKSPGCCRRCYDRRYHSLRLFGGMRERVLERDRFPCRACGARQRLLVHHRDRHNEPKVLVTLCSRCHVRIHHSLGVRHWLSGLLLKLWRELHRHEPMQLRLALGPVAGAERTENTFDQGGGRHAGAFPRRSRKSERTDAKNHLRCAGTVFGPAGGRP
jgi:hypothetical protein